MKRFLSFVIAISILVPNIFAEHFVILHTNDTHSLIDPDFDGKGGILRRKVLIDSIRKAEPAVILIDAGDVVQGTPYFSIFGGEVEYALMDSLGYDIMILGNHEFDNGIEPLSKFYKQTKATKISTNYEFKNTPLDNIFVPYIIKNIGTKKVGFLGVNLDPDGMIAASNCEGLVFKHPYSTADSLAGILKKQGIADAVIAISHIGYKYTKGKANDIDLVKNSHNIDLLIGGHSHTAINSSDPKSPKWAVANADGRFITICQAGSLGKYLGYIDVNLDDSLRATSKLLPVDARYDNRISTYLQNFISPYKHTVDSIMNNTLIVSEVELPNRRSSETMNWIADLAYSLGNRIYDGHIDLAVMNKGGMRRDLPKGNVSEGILSAMFPFDNKLVVLKISGKDLKDAFSIMAARGGDAVSAGVKVEYNNKNKITKATLNGIKIKDNKIYSLLTLDYLADGGDYMSPFKNAERIATDDEKFGDVVIRYMRKLGASGKTINASHETRMIKK